MIHKKTWFSDTVTIKIEGVCFETVPCSYFYKIFMHSSLGLPISLEW